MSIRSLISGVIATWALAGGLVLLVIVLATAVNAAGFTADMIAGLWGGDVPGLSGYEDGVTMLIGVAALAMFPYCQLHGGHAAVDIFMDKAPDWARRGVEILSGLLVTALALTMAVMLIYGTIETRADNVETAVLGWPVWVFMPTAVLSCLLWAIAALMETFGQEVSYAE
ncbi:TRAP transporter small permease [Alloyangia pacifica]|uniref:TRAP transporter small permease n=1 Tax=Alloyangia pacifica TaxID=311180 RepID=UPI001CD6CE76|nr:TRAP transporter small permease [Alloyangia pacifica]MCA0994941.1 TRAP transporter small permease [Alloyangia pacifica]